jgi:hypothetical protein
MNVTKDPLNIAETEVVTLYDDLSQELFVKQTVEQMDMTRNVCYLKSIGGQVKAIGPFHSFIRVYCPIINTTYVHFYTRPDTPQMPEYDLL